MACTTLSMSMVKEEKCSDTLLACRICLATDVKLFNIREWDLDQVFVDLMGTTWSAWDGFPQHVCVFCRALLLRAQELRARCRRAELLLTQALVQQGVITTSYIRSIDRSIHKLAHTFSHNCSNRDIKIIKHEDTQTDTQTPNCVFLIENKFEKDVKEFDTIVINDDNDHDTHFDSNFELETVHMKIGNIARNTPQANMVESYNKTVENVNTPQANIVECDKKTIKKDVKSTKRKVKNKPKTEKIKTEKNPRRIKRKGHAWRKKPFTAEDGFKEFEEMYNFKIISLSEEEMVKEMEDRKESDNYKRSMFKCELCYKGFLSPNTYSNHMKTHDSVRGPLECRLCRVRCLFPTNLEKHMLNAHRLRFRCDACAATVRTKCTAVLHAAWHAGTTFKCGHCDLQFLKVTSRSTHVRVMHPSEIADGGTCELCGETFLSAAGLKTHKARSHETEPALPRLRCRTCRVRFESYAAIARHRDAQPGGKCDNKHSSCTRCGEVFANEQELLTHRVQQHDLQIFTCDACSKTFESKESVATHINRVHRLVRAPAPPRPGYQARRARRSTHRAPVCEHCGKRFRCMAILKIHMNKHTGERPYKCTLCPKAYMSPHALNLHGETHSAERKWRCAECPASFMHQSSLYQHRRAIHSGEKAYQCHICSKTFTQSGSLHTHIKYVHMKLTPPPRKRSKKASA